MPTGRRETMDLNPQINMAKVHYRLPEKSFLERLRDALPVPIWAPNPRLAN